MKEYTCIDIERKINIHRKNLILDSSSKTTQKSSKKDDSKLEGSIEKTLSKLQSLKHNSNFKDKKDSTFDSLSFIDKSNNKDSRKYNYDESNLQKKLNFAMENKPMEISSKLEEQNKEYEKLLNMSKLSTESEKLTWIVDNMKSCVDMISNKIPDVQNQQDNVKSSLGNQKTEPETKLMKLISFFKMLCREVDQYQSFLFEYEEEMQFETKKINQSINELVEENSNLFKRLNEVNKQNTQSHNQTINTLLNKVNNEMNCISHYASDVIEKYKLDEVQFKINSENKIDFFRFLKLNKIDVNLNKHEHDKNEIGMVLWSLEQNSQLIKYIFNELFEYKLLSEKQKSNLKTVSEEFQQLQLIQNRIFMNQTAQISSVYSEWVKDKQIFDQQVGGSKSKDSYYENIITDINYLQSKEKEQKERLERSVHILEGKIEGQKSNISHEQYSNPVDKSKSISGIKLNMDSNNNSKSNINKIEYEREVSSKYNFDRFVSFPNVHSQENVKSLRKLVENMKKKDESEIKLDSLLENNSQDLDSNTNRNNTHHVEKELNLNIDPKRKLFQNESNTKNNNYETDQYKTNLSELLEDLSEVKKNNQMDKVDLLNKKNNSIVKPMKKDHIPNDSNNNSIPTLILNSNDKQSERTPKSNNNFNDNSLMSFEDWMSNKRI